jgi:multidrug efflux pump subunit AcrB
VLLTYMLPEHISAKRRAELAASCAGALKERKGMEHVLLLPSNPLDPFVTDPSLLLKIGPVSEHQPEKNENKFEPFIRIAQLEWPYIDWRLRDASGDSRVPFHYYPIDVALSGPESKRVQEWADAARQKLNADREEFHDVVHGIGPEPRGEANVEIDRDKVAALGVDLTEIYNTIQIALGSARVGNIKPDRLTREMTIEIGAGERMPVQDVQQLQVRSRKGEMVRIGEIAVIRELGQPCFLEFLNGQPMVRITGRASQNLKPEDARNRCAAVVEEALRDLQLDETYRLTWLNNYGVRK